MAAPGWTPEGGFNYPHPPADLSWGMTLAVGAIRRSVANGAGRPRLVFPWHRLRSVSWSARAGSNQGRGGRAVDHAMWAGHHLAAAAVSAQGPPGAVR